MHRFLGLAVAGGIGALLSSCAAPIERNVPTPAGGSVMDFDRGSGSFDSPETGTPAGAPNTIGHMDYETPAVVPGPVAVEKPPSTDVAEVRALQQALAQRGYYHGPINGQREPALLEALRRYELEHGGPPPLGTQVAGPVQPHAAPPPPPPCDGGAPR